MDHQLNIPTVAHVVDDPADGEAEVVNAVHTDQILADGVGRHRKQLSYNKSNISDNQNIDFITINILGIRKTIF